MNCGVFYFGKPISTKDKTTVLVEARFIDIISV